MNYKQIIEDFNTGVLDKEIFTLMVDNDDIFLSVDSGDEDLDELLEKAAEGKYGNGNGYQDIVKILQAAGANAERV